MTYIILESSDSKKLAKDVTHKLSIGWQLVGGVSTTRTVTPGGTHYVNYCQAMQADMS